MQALAAGGALSHDKFMGTSHVLQSQGGVAAENEALFDEVPFGQLMSSVLKEWGMPMYAGSSDTTEPPTEPPTVVAPAALPAPQRAPAPPPLRAAAGGGGVVASMRCLDTTHARGCTECTPAPLDGEDGALRWSAHAGRHCG